MGHSSNLRQDGVHTPIAGVAPMATIVPIW